MKRLINSRYAVVVAVVLVGFLIYSIAFSGGTESTGLTLGEYITAIDDGEVESAVIKDRLNRITGELTDGTAYTVSYPREFADELTIALADATPAIDIQTDTRLEPLMRFFDQAHQRDANSEDTSGESGDSIELLLRFRVEHIQSTQRFETS